MKALPRIIKAPTHFQRALWVLALLIGLLAAAYQLCLLVMGYMNFSTSISIITTQGSPPFPDVTLCHLDKNWTFRMLDDELGYKFSPQEFDDLIWRRQQDFEVGSLGWHHLQSLKGLPGYIQNEIGIHETIDRLRELFVMDCYIMYNWDPVPCFGEDGPLMPTNMFLDPIFGLCVTFSGLDELMKELKLILYLDDPYRTMPQNFDISDTSTTHTSAVGVKVVVHPPGSNPDIWLGSKNVYAGTDVELNVEGTLRSVLGPPYGMCIRPEEAMLYGQPINRHGYECYRMCARDHILAQCNCLHINYATNKYERESFPLCGTIHPENLTKTFDYLTCAMDTISSLDAIMEEACQCPLPCTQFTYEFLANSVQWPHNTYYLSFYVKYIRHKPFAHKFQGYEDLINISRTDSERALKMFNQLNLIEKNFAQVRILNHQKSYFHYIETPLVSPEALFGNVGGLLNLWVGITFITIIEILDFVYQCVSGAPAAE